jgi:hypothetical protein
MSHTQVGGICVQATPIAVTGKLMDPGKEPMKNR